MSGRRAGRRGGVVALAVLLWATTTAGYARGSVPEAPPAPAAAPVAATAGTGVLALGAVTPPVAGPGVAVTVTGTVTARAAALTAPVVRLALGSPTVVTRAAVEAWASGNAATTGQELGSVTLPGPVAVGSSVPFTITVPAGRIQLSRSFGVVPVALQVRDGASGASETVHTFVGWQRSKQYQPLKVAVVAPVTLPADGSLFDADPTTRTAAWTDAVASGGRMNRILDGTDVDGPNGPVPVTWAVDPAVLGPLVAAPSAAGSTGNGAGTATGTRTSTDPVAAVVAPLRARLASGATRHTVWALPYADPDLAATVDADPGNATVRGEVAAAADLGTALGATVTTGIAWPVDGSFADPRESGVQQAFSGTGLTAVLGSSSALPVTSGFTGQAPRRTQSGTTLLAWDDELSRLLLATTTPAQGALTAQRLLAETGAVLAESPGVSRTFLIAVPRSLDPDPGALRQVLGTLAQTPWVQPTSTTELIQQAGTQDPVASTSQGTWDAQPTAQVSASTLARIADARRSVHEVAGILGADGPAFEAQVTTLLDHLVSVRWREQPAGFAALDARVGQAVTTATSGISISPQTTNFLADEGTMLVTVVNQLPVAVEGVHLVLQPTNPRLRIPKQPDPFRIEAGSRAVVRVQAQAVAAGLVPVNVTLTTPDGTPVGVPAVIEVRANPPGNTLYVVGGAVVLLVLVAGTVRTVRRPRRPAATSPAALSAPAAPSAPEAVGPEPAGTPEADPDLDPDLDLDLDPGLGTEDPQVASRSANTGDRRMSTDRT